MLLDLIPGSDKGELKVDAGDMLGLIESLKRDLGEAFRQPLYTASGEPRPHSFVCLNGRAYGLNDVTNLSLRDGDVVLLVPPVGGG